MMAADSLNLAARNYAFSGLQEGFIVLNESLCVTDANDLANQLLDINIIPLGRPADELLADWGLIDDTSLKYPKSACQFRGLKEIELSSYPLENQGKAIGVLLKIKDLTEQKLTERGMLDAKQRYQSLLALSDRRADEISLLHNVRDALSDAESQEDIFQTVIALAADIYGYNLVSVYLLNDEELQLAHQLGHEEVLETIPLSLGVVGRVARTGQAAWASREKPDEDANWRDENLLSGACAPLVINKKVMGVFDIQSSSLSFSEADLKLCEALATYTSNALERIALLEDAREQERKYRELVEDAGQVIFRIDLQGHFTYVNPATARLCKYPKEQLETMHFLELVHKDYHEEIMAFYMQQVKSGQESSYFEFRLVTADGEEFWLGQQVQLVFEAGKPTYMQATASDITERVLTEQVLLERSLELESLNKDLRQFAVISSHDLQEPLRKIQAFGDRLRYKYQEQFDDKGKEYLERMCNSAGRMQRLLEDVQVFTHVGVDLDREPVNLNQSVEHAQQDLEALFAATETTLDVDALPSLMVDASQFKMVFKVLFKNAIIFRQEGSLAHIKVSVSYSEKSVKIHVKDNALGFDEAYKDRIFEVFQTLHADKENKGNGIGLPICRKIIEAHSGSIEVSSKEGEGSTFSLVLPIELLTSESRAALKHSTQASAEVTL